MENLFRMSPLTGIPFGGHFSPFALEQCLSVVLLSYCLLCPFCLFIFVSVGGGGGGVRSPGEVDVLVAPPYLGNRVCVSD